MNKGDFILDNYGFQQRRYRSNSDCEGGESHCHSNDPNKQQMRCAKTFRFDNGRLGYRYMESNEHIGKIVVTVGE